MAKYQIDYESLNTQWTATFARDFENCLQDFINYLSQNRNLPTKSSIPISKILHTFVGEKYTCRDFDIWHKYVTKPMFDEGWAMLYLPIIMQITTTAKVQELRMENLKWALANWTWITAIYGTESLTDFVTIYNDLGDLLETDFSEENALRERLNELLSIRSQLTD